MFWRVVGWLIMMMVMMSACSDGGAPVADEMPDAAAAPSALVGAYAGGYRATRMRTAPSAETTQADEPAYNIVALATVPGRVTFQVTETCAFGSTGSGAVATLDIGQRCTGFAGRSAQFTLTGGSAQITGSELTLTVTAEYTASGEAGTYTWRYTGRRR